MRTSFPTEQVSEFVVFLCLYERGAVVVSLESSQVWMCSSVFRSVQCLSQRSCSLPSRMGCSKKENVVMGDLCNSVMRTG